MSKTIRSSAQRSRPASPYDKDIVETQEEPLSSEHEVDHGVSLNPHQFPSLPSNPAGPPQPVAGMYMPYIRGPCMD